MSLFRFVKLPRGDAQPDEQRRQHESGRREPEPIATHEAAELVETAGRPGEHRLVAQVALEIHGQPIGRVVAAWWGLLETFHYDPIQGVLEQVDPLWRVG